MTSPRVMDKFLDDSIGDNFKLLPDLLRSLERQRDQLKDQLAGTTKGSLDTTNEWQNVVSDTKATIAELEKLKTSCISLSGGGEVESEDREKQLVGPEVVACAREIRPIVEEFMELERLLSYLQWVKRILQLSSQIDSHIGNGLLSEAVDSYCRLSTLCSQLDPSHCSHLRRLAQAARQHWRETLSRRVASDFSSILKELKWPFSTSALSSQAIEAWDKHKKRFTELFNLLLQLDEGSSSQPHSTTTPSCDIGAPVLLPLELLLEPLRKRFRFHFSGERKTNCKEKPEWYFTQVSSWIRDHAYFLEENIQPLLEVSAFHHVDARLEFMRGLLQEVETKISHDIPEMVYDEVLMSHLIDELLLFERELRTVLHYPPSCPSPFHNVMLEDVAFHKWLTLEKTFAVERLNQITSSPTAWQPSYSSMADADDTRVPECTEGLMSLIAGITDRYKQLDSVPHQLKFLELQSALMLEFHQDLSEAGKATLGSPLVPQFCAYLNASSYIAAVLREWGEQTLYLQLHYHSPKCPPQDEVTLGTPPPSLETLQRLRRQDPEFAASEGTAFDTVIEAFSSLVESMRGTIVQHVVDNARAKCRKCRKEKWHSLATQKDALALEVTPSVSDLLLSLGEQLAFIEAHVSPLLTPPMFETICDKIDQLFISEVVMGSHFSEGGAAQLRHDVTKGLVALLSHCCDDIASRQLLERTREACTLLQLLPGSAKLIQELLEGAVRAGPADNEAFSAAVTALNDMGIHALDPGQAEQILRLKINIS